MSQGDFKEALNRWAIVREKFPNNHEGYTRATTACMEIGDIEQAERVCKQGMENLPFIPEIFLAYAEIFLTQKKYKKALDYLNTTVLPKFPDNVSVLTKILYIENYYDLNGSKKQLFGYDLDILFSTFPCSKEEFFPLAPEIMWDENPEEALILALRKWGKFDTEDFLIRYPDVRRSGIDPIKYYVTYGIQEKQCFYPKCSPDPTKQKILFVSHEMSYTGAPLVVLNLCLVAKQLGYEPIVWSIKDGTFRNEFIKNNICVQIVPISFLYKESYINIIKSCLFALCNTMITYKYVHIIKNYVPCIWYIMEANIKNFCENNILISDLIKTYDDIFCVSEYNAKSIYKYREKPVNILHNYVEDMSKYADKYVCGTNEKVKFVQFGYIHMIKGYDILISAYKSMPEEYQNKCEFYFAGGISQNVSIEYENAFFAEVYNIPSLHYLGFINDDKKKIEELSRSDVIVVASRDEPCSLVLLEGAMLSKPILVTENVGAKYMVSDENGIIVPSENVQELAKALMFFIDHKEKLADMGKKSRLLYERYASISMFMSSSKNLFERFIHYESDMPPFIDFKEEEISIHKENSIDIIVTVYNALEYVKKCIQSLKDNLCDDFAVHIIIVNDFSDDATSEWLRNLCKDDSLFTLIENSSNIGYTKSVNIGMKVSNAQYVILLNSDTIVTKGWLTKMVRCMRSNPKIGIVGPLSNHPSFQEIPCIYEKDGNIALNGLSQEIMIDKMAEIVEKVSLHLYPPIQILVGFCYMIRRNVIDTIGFMDEVNFPIGYGEEDDYSIRAYDAGFLFAVADDTFIFHAQSKSFTNEKKIAFCNQAKRTIYEKHTPQKRNIFSMRNQDHDKKFLDIIRAKIRRELNKIMFDSESNDDKLLLLMPDSIKNTKNISNDSSLQIRYQHIAEHTQIQLRLIHLLPEPGSADAVVFEKEIGDISQVELEKWIPLWKLGGGKIIYEIDDDTIDTPSEKVQLVSYTADAIHVLNSRLYEIFSKFNFNVHNIDFANQTLESKCLEKSLQRIGLLEN